MKKLIAICFVVFGFCTQNAFAAPNLVAEMNMDVRAETATAAKKEATDSAIRGSVIQVLSRYSDRAIVENLIMSADDSVLQDIVDSTSISNEKSSKTAYSAKFTITMDRAAIEKWYADNDVPNFLSAADDSKNKVIIYIDIKNGLSDWTALNQMIRTDGDNYGLSMRSIFGDSASAYILSAKKAKFQNLCAANGWSVSNKDGVIRISK